jgi:tripartite-type tricarboxylate transporter receptor subunit TctC
MSIAAQDWPQQPIHIIVSFAPGGGADIIGRVLADAIQDRLGKPVIVENKPGAGGILGNELVANATPDGYTLGIMTAGQIIAAVTRKAVRYDTSALTPVAQVATTSLTTEKTRARLGAVGVIVRGSTAQDFGQLIANEYKHWDAVREAAGIVRQ